MPGTQIFGLNPLLSRNSLTEIKNTGSFYATNYLMTDYSLYIKNGTAWTTPGTGYRNLVAKTDGIYTIDENGLVTGPFGQLQLKASSTLLAAADAIDISGLSFVAPARFMVTINGKAGTGGNHSIRMWVNADETAGNYYASDPIVANTGDDGNPFNAVIFGIVNIDGYTSAHGEGNYITSSTLYGNGDIVWGKSAALGSSTLTELKINTTFSDAFAIGTQMNIYIF